MRKKLIAGALAAFSVGAFSITPSPAHAASGTKPSGWTTCTQLTNGWFCIRYDSRGYDVAYKKNAGAKLILDFELWCKSGLRFRDGGDFPADSGTLHTYLFRVGSQGKCQGVLRQGGGGPVITSTPYLTR